MRGWGTKIAVLACAGALAGCTAGAAGTGDSPTRAATGVTYTADQGLLLPLDAYRAGPREQLRIDRAQAVLFRRCMKELGFGVPGGDPSAQVEDEPNRERYMLTDGRAAEARGYHPPPAEQKAARQAAEAESTTPSTEYLTAAGGKGAAQVNGRLVPPGGCAGQAADALSTHEDREALQLVEDLRGWSWSNSQRDSRVTAVFEAWSACMEKAGFHYRTPMAANDDPAFAGDRPTDREISTAVADVRCKRDVDLARVWAETEASYQIRATHEHEPALEKARAAVATQLSKAAAVLGEDQGRGSSGSRSSQ